MLERTGAVGSARLPAGVDATLALSRSSTFLPVETLSKVCSPKTFCLPQIGE
ncbi:hypothetical protein JMJ77_0000754 [Colletotrichum scovillei]|uniref:Uncharacterized protein n=1 Tax=Colletotrichum scovillei TaxID=1209932 RepID=A0A9P7RCI0_9PEZI|nr:hypothetical protein JMJ77_0000754 [Colletotrichum scovillei]KAG7071963.1 hypothetical protein JMJ76_0004828 [Colletotrichum scovillei]KAG7080305.1 hypothetical protein JMJ78_0007402 [Colletotrichum scovillei]